MDLAALHRWGFNLWLLAVDPTTQRLGVDRQHGGVLRLEAAQI